MGTWVDMNLEKKYFSHRNGVIVLKIPLIILNLKLAGKYFGTSDGLQMKFAKISYLFQEKELDILWQ